ncbi:type II toxin-antitoxin system VapC family toxin [Microbacterium sp. NEAU-LLC]|uniref:Type II toxin-antitoxin system VapC family toxin n=1 Tax=Microbacterium helvum TaxID=2773713 RepID=A0ABR8NNM2_9MICO|nr:type II toxin-antitoxin system VapC family toxin [Microbacterium helvum]MBD3942234.1 type II toxin-antitoxin system VapC family toxin [Microbacterium helvum]
MSGVELVGIDTNVLLRYIVRDDEEQYQAARRLLESLTVERPGFIAQVTLAELAWVLGRVHKLTRTDCLLVIHRLVQTEVLEFDDGESVVRALALADEGADFADALIEGIMNLFGATETVTFDRHAAEKLGWRLLE